MAKERSCKDCEFWHVYTVHQRDYAVINECRRYPPNKESVVTRSAYWCGEFKEYIQPKERKEP